jgi:hypothetical protein
MPCMKFNVVGTGEASRLSDKASHGKSLIHVEDFYNLTPITSSFCNIV